MNTVSVAAFLARVRHRPFLPPLHYLFAQRLSSPFVGCASVGSSFRPPWGTNETATFGADSLTRRSCLTRASFENDHCSSSGGCDGGIGVYA